MSPLEIAGVGELLDEVRHGRPVLLVDDREERGSEGVVMIAAEHCAPEHVTMMARRARGLVCLALTRAHCERLDLPPMVASADGDGARANLPGFLACEHRLLPRGSG